MSKDIVILHGWGCSSSVFSKLKKNFEKQKFSLFSPDLPGFGKNLPLKVPFDLNDYVDFVESFVKKKGLKRFFLIGHSFGGRIAVKYTCKYQDKVLGLILSGAPGIRKKTLRIYLFFFLAKLGKLLFALAKKTVGRGLFFLNPLFNFFYQIARKVLYFLAREKDYYQASSLMRQVLKKVISEDLSPLLPRIKVPTLLLWGENDKVIPLKIAYKMHEKILNSKLVIVSKGTHKLPYERPEVFAKETLKFILSRHALPPVARHCSEQDSKRGKESFGHNPGV